MTLTLARQAPVAISPYHSGVTAGPLALEPTVGSSMADRAYAVIMDRLIMLDIRPNDPIDDGALAQELGIGRTPVREALKRLETDRLVVAYARRGTFATGVDIADLAGISEIRAQLEPWPPGGPQNGPRGRPAPSWPTSPAPSRRWTSAPSTAPR
jgi:hypothetical protein